MKHGSLFSGIGGFDLAAEWMGWENVFHCEWNPFGQKVLKHYWPNAVSFTDITKTDFTPYANTIDIISGGFPCQPFSLTGKRKGTADDRYLWPEMLRAIAQIHPVWVVAENVYGLLSENGGSTINSICSDLEAVGYERPVIFDCTADSFDLPTMERHIWIIAKSKQKHSKGSAEKPVQNLQKQKQFSRSYQGELRRWNTTESRVLRFCERVSDELPQIEAYGNAIPPGVAFQIFKAIQTFEEQAS